MKVGSYIYTNSYAPADTNQLWVKPMSNGEATLYIFVDGKWTPTGGVGESAYEAAVKAGFNGSKQEWLDSLALKYSDLTAEQKADLVKDAVSAAERAAQAVENIENAINDIDVSSTDGAITALVAKQGALENKVDVLGPKIDQFKDTINSVEMNYTNGYIKNDGTFVESDEDYVSDFIDVNEGDAFYWYYGNTSSSSRFCVMGYDSSGNIVRYILTNNANYTARNGTVPEGVSKIRASVRADYDNAKITVNGVKVWSPVRSENPILQRVGNLEQQIEPLDNLSDMLVYQEKSVAITLSGTLQYAVNLGTAIGTDVSSSLEGTESENYHSAVVNCQESDKFILSFFHGTLASWFIIDKDNRIVAVDNTSRAEIHNDVNVIVPSGGVKMYFQTYIRNGMNPSQFIAADHTLTTRVQALEDILDRTEDSDKDKNVKVKTSTYSEQRVTFAQFSDIHNNATGLDAVLEYISAYDEYINDILFTGDFGYAWEDSIAWWTQRDTSNILCCLGNHEIQTYIDGVLTRVAKTERIGIDAYNKYIAPFVENWGVTQPEDAATYGYSFYYKDYGTLRLIVLDAYNYNNPQKTWMQGVLADALTQNKQVVVMVHQTSRGISKTYCNFDSFGLPNPTTDPWNNLLTEYDAHEDIQDFIDDGGQFVCWITGHMHRDHFGFIDGYPNQLVIAIDTSKPDYDGSDLYRENGDVVVNLISFDLTQKYLYINRLGATSDMYGRSRKSIVWDYGENVLVRYN